MTNLGVFVNITIEEAVTTLADALRRMNARLAKVAECSALPTVYWVGEAPRGEPLPDEVADPR